MNKRKAKDEAWSNTRSWADIKELIDSCREGSRFRPSKVNKALTVEQALDIFDAAIAERDPDEVPKGHRHDVYRRREMMSGDGLMIHNILRECA